MGHLHSSGWHGVGGLDKAGLMRGSPAKNSTAGACFLCLCILENFCLHTGRYVAPLAKSEPRVSVQTKRTLKTLAMNLEGLKGIGDEP